jgi:hypothetical protein
MAAQLQGVLWQLFSRIGAKASLRQIVKSPPLLRTGAVDCPHCGHALDFEDVFRSAWCWSGAEIAVVANCPRCGDTLYFSPRAGFIEWGMLGASPVSDPIPMARYAIELSCDRQGEWVEIGYRQESRRLPSARLHDKRHRAAHSHKAPP